MINIATVKMIKLVFFFSWVLIPSSNLDVAAEVVVISV